jgi:hypothetical protein
MIFSLKMECQKHPFLMVGKVSKDCIRWGSQKEVYMEHILMPSKFLKILLSNGKHLRARVVMIHISYYLTNNINKV